VDQAGIEVDQFSPGLARGRDGRQAVFSLERNACELAVSLHGGDLFVEDLLERRIRPERELVLEQARQCQHALACPSLVDDLEDVAGRRGGRGVAEERLVEDAVVKHGAIELHPHARELHAGQGSLERRGMHQIRNIGFPVAMLAHVQVEHELNERAMQLRERPDHHDEPRAGNAPRRLEIHPQGFAERHMILGLK